MVIGLWVVLMIIIDIIEIPHLASTRADNAEASIDFFMASINRTMYGIFILTLITSFIFRAWTKRNWYISLFFLVISGFYVVADFKP